MGYTDVMVNRRARACITRLVRDEQSACALDPLQVYTCTCTARAKKKEKKKEKRVAMLCA